MRDKSEMRGLLRSFIIMAKTQFGKEVKVVKTNNGTEFKSGHMLNAYSDKEIIHQTS